MPIVCLAKVSPLNPSTGNRVDLYISSAQNRAVTGLNGQVWEPAMAASPTLSINLWQGDFREPIDTGGASFSVNMGVLKMTYAGCDAYNWSGAPVEIYAEEPGTAWPWSTRFKGRVASYSRRSDVLTINASIETELFDKNILTATYAGTGGAEGGADLKGRLKPLVVGWAQNVEPILIDTVNNVYQFSGYGAIEAVSVLYERAASFGASVGDYATYAALVAAAIPAGRWGTCLAAGMVRLGAPAAGVITGDVRGHRVGSTTPRLTGAVISALATIAGVSTANIETATLTSLDTAVPYPINLVLTEQVQWREMAAQLALACNWQSGITLPGKWFTLAVTLSGSEVITLNAQGAAMPQVIMSDEADVSLPYYQTIFGANRCWRTQTSDEIAFTAELVPLGLYAAGTTYREGNIVDLADGSTWVYINATASSGNAPPTWPTTSNAYWSNRTPPIAPASIGAATSAEVAAALALAQSKGKVWTGPSMPSLAESAVGDTWIGPDGTFYERVNEGGITLAGYAVTLAGFRPRLGWTLSANQVLRDTLVQADAAYASANDAIDQLIGLADDDLISRNEKITKLVPEVARLEDKWTALSTLAASLSVSTSAASSARSSWYTFLGGLSPAWNDINQDTPVTRASYDAARDAYDTALYNLDKDVKAKAATVSSWAGVSGSGKPEDNATRNAFQGNYNAGTTYIYGDVVLWPKAAGGTGSSYIRKNTGPTTGVAPSNTTHWGIMVEVGADGLPGTPGANGITYYTWYAYADSADGQVNFTTGAPGTRVYQGVAFNKTTATESSTPSDYTWSPYVGPPNFGLAAANGAEVAGSKIIRRAAGSGDWIPQVYSTESFVGGAYVSFKLEQGSDGTYGGVMVGLNTDPTATDYTTLDYAIYAEISAGSPLFAVESGAFTNIGSFTATDTFAVHYDGANVRYYKNGTVIRTVAVSSGIRFFLDSAMANPGTRASIISWAAAGAVGPQGPQGTAGLPGAPGANGVTYYTWYAYADSADGQINFTTGSPGSRVYQGVAFNKTTATESTTPSDYTWSRYVGPPAFGLAAANGGEVAGAKILNRSGPDWTPQVYSTESFVGGAFVSWKLELNGDSAYGGVMIGLNTDPTATGWESLDYAMYLENGSNVLAYAESGSINTIASYAPTDTFAIQYDGANVRYYKNGTVIRTVAASAGIRFFLDSALSGAPGAKATITAWSAAGAVGPQGNTGPTGPTGPAGANGANGAPGAPAIGFVQDDNPGSGTFVSQTWYRPTSKEWYRWTGGAWSRILGNLSAQDLIADSAFLADAVVLKAKIGDLQVDTIKIAGNAVTTTSSAYSTAAVNFVDNVWVVMQTITITAVGGSSVLVLFNAEMEQSASTAVMTNQIRVRRNGTVIYGPVTRWAGYNRQDVSIGLSDSPPAGTTTYTVECWTEPSAGVGNMSFRSLAVLETKR